MKPAWDQLSGEHAGSSSVLIADVDCTAEGEALCKQYSVGGYPTIKYFVDGDSEGQDYQGGRDYDSLAAFVDENMAAKCDVENPTGCTDKEIGYIEKMKVKTADDRKSQISRLEKMQGSSMKPELKQWLVQRLRILKGLNAGSGDEL
mmetsp:Transcript_14570/g.19028  ORF Transcript_14570/g.19028 Transcript_14570/m.19028 type:complete len:147 (+) Transcript_14570:239-679(+)